MEETVAMHWTDSFSDKHYSLKGINAKFLKRYYCCSEKLISQFNLIETEWLHLDSKMMSTLDP